MPRPTAPPRLWLRKRRDGTDQWVILDAGRQIRTGAPAHDRRKAEKALERYLGRKHKPDFGDGHPARVAIADALAAYSEKHAPTTKRPDLIGSAALKLAEFFGSTKNASGPSTKPISKISSPLKMILTPQMPAVIQQKKPIIQISKKSRFRPARVSFRGR